jgi:DNA-binding GntR family transcriptional regulator
VDLGDRLKKLRRSNLSEDAYTFIRKLFLSGNRYNPGDKVSVEELSRELGVSRTPLWGAINRLEAEGIVEVVPRLGVYLINYDPQRMLDIYLVREALEGIAARTLAEKITDAQIEALEAIIEAQRKYLKAGQTDRYYFAALEFHEAIISLAGNPTLEKILTAIYAQVRAMRVQRSYAPMHLPQSCEDHEKLLDAFRKRDGDLAEREARAHLRDLAQEIRVRLDSDKPSPRRATAHRIAS